MLIIQYLTESNYVSTIDVQTHLKSKGIDSQIRTIQRDLNLLSEIVPLEVRTEDKPYSWRWKRLKNTSIHTLSMAQVLALRIVETELKEVIPNDLYEQLQPLFTKSYFISGLAQIDKSVDSDTKPGPKFNFAHISLLQRIAMHIRAKAASKIKRNKSIIVNYDEQIYTKLITNEETVIKLLKIELEKNNLGFLCDLLDGKV